MSLDDSSPGVFVPVVGSDGSSMASVALLVPRSVSDSVSTNNVGGVRASQAIIDEVSGVRVGCGAVGNSDVGAIGAPVGVNKIEGDCSSDVCKSCSPGLLSTPPCSPKNHRISPKANHHPQIQKSLPFLL